MTSTADRRDGLRIAAGLASFLVISLFVVQSSQAAFTASDVNTGNEFEIVQIDLDADATIPLFAYSTTAVRDSSDMAPGESRDACLVLTYTGGTDSLTPVNVAATAATGSYADRFTVAYEVDPADDTCSGTWGGGTGSWTADGAYSGASTWTPSQADDTASVRFRVTLDPALSGSAPQGATVDGLDLTFSVSTTP